MPRKNVAFTDSTLRDGQETILGGRLRLDLVEPILDSLDEVGFHSIEAWGGGTFLASLSRLHEDPWERLKALKKRLKKTPLQMLIRGRCLVGDRPFSRGFIARFLKQASQLGVDVVRVFDPVNDLDGLSQVARAAAREKLAVQASILCSDRVDMEHYQSVLRNLDSSSFDSIGLFDPIGMLSRSVAGELSQFLLESTGLEIFVHIHRRNGSAVSPVNRIWEQGASIIDTCFSAFSGPGSLPSLDALLAELQGDEVSKRLNLRAMQDVSNFLLALRRDHFDKVSLSGQPVSLLEKTVHEMSPTPAAVNAFGLGEKGKRTQDQLQSEIDAIMNELALVTIVAPVSGITTRQAALNLQSAKRYDHITGDFLRLIRGDFGKVTVPPTLGRFVHERREHLHAQDEIGERTVRPLNHFELGAPDLLSFEIFPREWMEMVQARQNLHGQEKFIAAAALALLEEERLEREPYLAALAAEPAPRPSRWRNALRSEHEGESRKRAFLLEPF